MGEEGEKSEIQIGPYGCITIFLNLIQTSFVVVVVCCCCCCCCCCCGGGGGGACGGCCFGNVR